jgi:hypothetical protein
MSTEWAISATLWIVITAAAIRAKCRFAIWAKWFQASPEVIDCNGFLESGSLDLV